MYHRNGPSALFHSLHHAHKRRVAEALASRGLADLSAPWLLVSLLHAEADGRPWSQRDVARQMELSPATVAVSLKALERGGYVARAADERDARRNRVSLTEKGAEAVRLCVESFQSVDEGMLSGFTPEEAEQLSGFLTRMTTNLGGAQPPLCPEGKEREG